MIRGQLLGWSLSYPTVPAAVKVTQDRRTRVHVSIEFGDDVPTGTVHDVATHGDGFDIDIVSSHGDRMRVKDFKMHDASGSIGGEGRQAIDGWATAVAPIDARFRKYKRVVYDITNFVFRGSNVRQVSSRNRNLIIYGGLHRVRFGDFYLTLLLGTNSHSNFRRAGLERSVHVTAKLRITASTLSELHEFDDLALDTLTVLSLGIGHRVDWTLSRLYDQNYRSSGIRVRSSLARNYSGMPLLSAGLTGIRVKELDASLPSMIEQLRSQNEHLATPATERTVTNAIYGHLEARSQDSYLELRALASITALEILVSRWAAINDWVRIVSKGRFDRVVRAVKELMNPPSDTFRNLTEAELDAMSRKLPELNRYSSADILTAFGKYYGSGYIAQNVREYLQIRNKLVHEGGFPESRLTKYNRGSEQYALVVEFVDNALLRILGYSGGYQPVSGWGRGLTPILKLDRFGAGKVAPNS